MDKKNINIKIDELNAFLQLPNLNSLIKDIRYDNNILLYSMQYVKNAFNILLAYLRYYDIFILL